MTLETQNNFQQYQNYVNLALSESLGQELRFAKRINSNGVTVKKIRSREV